MRIGDSWIQTNFYKISAEFSENATTVRQKEDLQKSSDKHDRIDRLWIKKELIF